MNREFDPCKGDVTLGQNLVRMTRVLNIAKEKVLEPDALWGMGFAASAVVGIGIFEGALMTRRGASGRIKFCVRYGISNLLPSIIWATTSPKLLAQRMKLDVKLLLRDIDKANLVELAPNKAKQAMRIESFYVLRSIIAGFVGISQILRIMGIFSDAQIQYKELVLAGREPLQTGVRERVIRLAGRTSDCTALALKNYGDHIVPIYEDASLVQDTIGRASYGGRIPCFWCIPSGKYSFLAGDNRWKGFNVSKDWFIKTPTGPVLVVEADSSVGEQSLALGVESNNDLSIDEMGQGFVSLGKIATMAHESARMVRVVLADPAVRIESGGGSHVSYRNYLETHKEIDIFIDAKIPLLRAIEGWAHGAVASHSNSSSRSNKNKGTIVFDTRNKVYFETMKSLMEQKGWRVIDRPSQLSPTTASTSVSVQLSQQQASSSILTDMYRKSLSILTTILCPGQWFGFLSTNAPSSSSAASASELEEYIWLIYEETTVDTVHKVRQLVCSGLVKPSQCCALLDKHEGIDEIRALSEELGSMGIDSNKSKKDKDDKARLNKEASMNTTTTTNGTTSSSSHPKCVLLHYICSSVIYEDLFADTRRLIREGRSNEEIQRLLDVQMQNSKGL